MKVVLTGSSGLLGSSLKKIFFDQGTIILSINYSSAWEPDFLKKLKCLQASFFIHAAANTDVEWCEMNPNECYYDNYLLTDRIAQICAEIELPLLYLSSTGVYGKQQMIPYKEYNAALPTTHHHRSKYLGEKSVLIANKKNLVVRTGWLFGGNSSQKKNFVWNRIREALVAKKSNLPIFSNNEQFGCPTFSDDLASQLLLLMKGNYTGIFNIVSEGNASRFDYVRSIINIANISVEIKKKPANEFDRKADVSNNEMAENWKMKKLGIKQMPHWRDSLNFYISNIYKNYYE